ADDHHVMRPRCIASTNAGASAVTPARLRGDAVSPAGAPAVAVAKAGRRHAHDRAIEPDAFDARISVLARCGGQRQRDRNKHEDERERARETAHGPLLVLTGW